MFAAPQLPRIVVARPKPHLGFDGVTASEGSLRDMQPNPDCRKEWERIVDAFEKPRRNRPERPARGRQRRFYVPKPGNQAGPLFGFWCRRSGVRLATCRGTIHHVMREAKTFAEAQGGTLADIYVRVEVVE